jgi:hypothetical protein
VKEMSATFQIPLARKLYGFASIFLLALTGGCATSDNSKVGAGEEQYSKSLAGVTQARITFFNRSGQRVKVYWLDYAGNLVFYKSLEAGESYDQETYFTHPWLITDAHNNAWKTYLATSDHTLVEITSPSKK